MIDRAIGSLRPLLMSTVMYFVLPKRPDQEGMIYLT